MTPQIRALLVLAAFSIPLAACPSGTQGFAFVSDLNGAYQAEGPVGSTVIVEGIQFGAIQGSSTLSFTNSLGLAALPATVTSWSANFVIATVPVGAVNGPISLDNGNGANLGLTFFTVTPQAPFNPAGLTWAAASALPVGLSGHATAFATIRGGTTPNPVIYSVGGADSTGTPGTTVYYSAVPALGPIGTWTATTALPVGVAFAAAVVTAPANSAVNNTTGYLMVIGGATSNSGTSTGAIYHAPLNANGSVGAWTQVGKLPSSAALHSLAAVVFMGHLYVYGGANSNNNPVANVYRVVVQPDGTVRDGDWVSEISLPFPRAHFGFGQFNGQLYAFGGDSGSISPNDSLSSTSAVSDIVSAPVDLFSRNLTGWTKNGVSLPAARMAATAVVGGAPGAGKVLISGGLVTGGPADEELYASINADGSVGAFTVASALISTLCGGCSIFNQAATGYINTNGEFHLAVLGGDNRLAPSKKRKETSTY
jgi:Kelch motif